ncbi:MAG: conjugal transfer protein TraF [Gammaproteobacteria bacterium]|nr:conjugal transfer protein TraF [Gammaproteobacteria bacterium]
MKEVKIGFCAVALAAASHSVMAAPFAHEARSLGMGNVGIATADIATAPFANPAMLSFQKVDDDFSLLLTAGAFFSDNDGVIDDIDAFQESADDFEKLAIAQGLDGKVIAPELSGALAVGFTTEKYSMAVSARMDVVVAGGLSNVSQDIFTIDDPTYNLLNIVGAQTTEVGFSIARSFELMEKKVSIGLTPKIVNVEAVKYSESISLPDTGLDNLTDDIQDLGDFTTLDLGMVMAVSDNVRVGVTVKNLMTEEMSFQTTDANNVTTTTTLLFDTQLKVGVAYSGDVLTLGADLDLTENDSIVSTGTVTGLKRQNLSLGMEFNAFDYAQLRLGMIKNMADGISSADKEALYTAGVGLWLGFNLDLAVMSGAGESLGAVVQTGFKF